MVKVKTVEKKIWDIEGFDVRIITEDGGDVRGDRGGMPQYPYDREAKNNMTVARWRSIRFRPNYPGFRIEVLDGDGQPVRGNTNLGTVRDSYTEDEDE